VDVDSATLDDYLRSAVFFIKNTGTLAHTTAKAGIIGMTRQLAMEGREHGIRANSISPGVIETNQTREHRAVFVYQIDSYHYWQHRLGRSDFSFGQFGENFTRKMTSHAPIRGARPSGRTLSRFHP
jgi:NAD(P)-dependent dehydrogenase (short-subunit alcohol dehydrogenase family)